jgi:hypothetical protein
LNTGVVGGIAKPRKVLKIVKDKHGNIISKSKVKWYLNCLIHNIFIFLTNLIPTLFLVLINPSLYYYCYVWKYWEKKTINISRYVFHFVYDEVLLNVLLLFVWMKKIWRMYDSELLSVQFYSTLQFEFFYFIWMEKKFNNQTSLQTTPVTFVGIELENQYQFEILGWIIFSI